MAKSSVFGLGRNLKHRPTKSTYHASAGNIHMRGKRKRLMGCGCCVCVDMREQLMAKEAKKEILQCT
jgi:hypothetical protein